MVSVNLYSEKTYELEKFLSSFYNTNFNINNSLTWQHTFNNPIEITEIIAAFIDNVDEFKIIMWISLDKGIYINVNEENANNLIKYLFERYPY